MPCALQQRQRLRAAEPATPCRRAPRAHARRRGRGAGLAPRAWRTVDNLDELPPRSLDLDGVIRPAEPLGRDRDGAWAAPNVDGMERRDGGGADRGHRARGSVDDVGGRPVRGDRDRVRERPALEALPALLVGVLIWVTVRAQSGLSRPEGIALLPDD